MATIAEIIAAKKAKQAGGTATPAATPSLRTEAQKESIAERIELDEAIARIDPPGKREARKSAGMILTKAMPVPPKGEPRGQATPIAGPDQYPELRSLSRTQGEAIPQVPANADKEVSTWHEALNSFESSLCVMRDPHEAEVIWLAIRPDRECLPPLLVYRLPWTLWDHPNAPRPENEPF